MGYVSCREDNSLRYSLSCCWYTSKLALAQLEVSQSFSRYSKSCQETRPKPWWSKPQVQKLPCFFRGLWKSMERKIWMQKLHLIQSWNATEMQQTFFDKKIPLGSHGPLWVMAAAALPSTTFNHRSLGFRNPRRWSEFKGVSEARFWRDDLVQGFLDALEVPMDAIVALHDAMFSCVVLSKIWKICEG